MVRRFCLLMVRRPSYARRHTILREPHAMSNRWRTACGRSSGPQSVRVGSRIEAAFGRNSMPTT